MVGEHWTAEPEAEDFPAAESYLSLLIGPAGAAKLAKALRKQQTLQHFAAKDILRAAGLPNPGGQADGSRPEPRRTPSHPRCGRSLVLARHARRNETSARIRHSWPHRTAVSQR